MATFIVSIEIDNDAFQPDPGLELQGILFNLSKRVRLYGPSNLHLLDSNGNRVGFTDVWEDSKPAPQAS